MYLSIPKLYSFSINLTLFEILSTLKFLFLLFWKCFPERLSTWGMRRWKAKIVARFGQIWRLSQICSYACLLSLSYYYSFNLFVCGVSELERELLLLVYIMIKFLFISSALSRIGENEPSSSIKRPLACSKLCWLLSREKAFIAAEVVANNQVSSRVTEDYIYTIGSGRSDITSKLQLKIYYCTGLFLRRWWWWRKCATTFHQIMNFTHP